MSDLPRRPAREALHLRVRPTTRATITFYAAGRDVPQNRALDELVALGDLALKAADGGMTLESLTDAVRATASPRIER